MSYVNKAYIPYIMFIICIATRLAFFGRYVDDWDGVNFVFALTKGYDVFQDQPHFHGYPVYMLASWIAYLLWPSEIGALILPGILFSSLAIFPLYAITRRMFTRQTAALASALYIINPQVWLQAEKTLSDAFGLFFVVMFSYFFYRAIESNGELEIEKGEQKIWNRQTTVRLESLFLGSALLGLGIGVRISYMAFIVVWGFTCFMVCREISVKKGILYGFAGFGLGIIAWFVYLLGRFGIVDFFDKFTSHSDYHFNEQGYSILAATDYFGRFITIAKNIFAHSLGAWWIDAPLIRLFPTVIMAMAVTAYVIAEKMDLKNKFLLVSIVSYLLWLLIVQAAIRQTMVLVPFVVIVVSAGIFHFVKGKVNDKQRPAWRLPVMLFFFIAPMTFDSGRLLWINREVPPPQVAMIKYITENYERDSSKLYCLNIWRLFQYYAPEWHDKSNRYVYFTDRISNAEKNLMTLHPMPEHALISSTLYERDKYRDRLLKVKEFRRDDYAVAEYNRLALYRFNIHGEANPQTKIDAGH